MPADPLGEVGIKNGERVTSASQYGVVLINLSYPSSVLIPRYRLTRKYLRDERNPESLQRGFWA